MAANRFRAEVDAGEFGLGYTIRLDMDGQARLESEFGEFDFAQKVQIGLAVLSAKYITAFLRVALRNGDDELVMKSTGATADFLPVIPGPLEPIGRKCLDAFALFRYGKDHETWAAEIDVKQPAKKPTANPTKGTDR